MRNKLISICIPSYNRPVETVRLLNSIDSKAPEKVEIVICEDRSPEREKIKESIQLFSTNSEYEVKYFENEENFGYDRNLRELIMRASGEWLVFMGNDDAFVPGALDKLINFLEKNKDLGYVLRSYRSIDSAGKAEYFRYYSGNKFFKAGEDSYLQLFRKSVFISGFTIRRALAAKNLVNDFDGTLLFQLYLVGEVSLKHETAYFDEPLTEQYAHELLPSFGNAEAERGMYTPGVVTPANSINFMKGFFKIAKYLDKKYQLNSAKKIAVDISKYSYPVLSIQRDKGLVTFLKYAHNLSNLGLSCTMYYYIYVILLAVFGKSIVDKGIALAKKILGKTPEL